MSKKKIPYVNFDDIEEHCQIAQEEDDFLDMFTHSLSSRTMLMKHNKYEVRKKAQNFSSTPRRGTLSQKEQQSIDTKPLRIENMKFERTLDMHGMRVQTAYTALLPFIQQSYCSHIRTVLVITGKGKNSALNISVLRESVLTWITEYPFNEVIETYGTPHERCGGEGAIGIILRPFNKNRVIRWNLYSLSSYI
ncbi:MAG: Smr/MutS family protein [Desulfovibrionaceae bacterium]|nr:Smr/MutS family protein [Desulfovibrionaceae bacterium]